MAALYNFHAKPKKVPLVKTKYRIIKTTMPSPSWFRLMAEFQKYEGRAMYGGQLPVVWDRAEDFQVYDPDGNKWIDFTSAIFLSNSGHSNPAIIRAIEKQIKQRLLTAYNYPTEIRAKFLKKLVQMAGKFAEKALLFSAGTEATECALPLMRLHGRTKSNKKIAVITFRGNMHGVTMGAEILKGDFETLKTYAYSDPNVYYIDFPFPWESDFKRRNWRKQFQKDMEILRKSGLRFENICGFMIESFHGWAASFFPKEYIQELAKFAGKHSALIAFDDVQGGFGRTGKLFAFEHYGVEPDLFFVGKGLSSSLPLSAVLGRKKYIDLAPEGSLHSTHSGNPVSMAAGLANLEVLEKKKLVSRSRQKGIILHRELNKLKQKYPHRIKLVLGKGLLAALHSKNPKTDKPDGVFASKVCERALEKGLILVHTGRESIKIAPPLTIPVTALQEGIRVLEESIHEIDKGL